MPYPTEQRFKILQQQVQDSQQIAAPAPTYKPQMLPGLVVDYIPRTDSGFCLKVIPFTPKVVTQAGELTFTVGSHAGTNYPDGWSHQYAVPVYPIDCDPTSVTSNYSLGQPIAYFAYYGVGQYADVIRGTYVCVNSANENMFPVILVQVGGEQAQYVGETLYPASWRYDVYDLNQNLLAVNVPLYNVRSDNVACQPAVCGTAVIAPQLFLTNPGQIPPPTSSSSSAGTSSSSSSTGGGGGSSSSSSSSTNTATPIRLWHAYEFYFEDIDCVPSPLLSSSSSGGSSSSSSH